MNQTQINTFKIDFIVNGFPFDARLQITVDFTPRPLWRSALGLARLSGIRRSGFDHSQQAGRREIFFVIRNPQK
jgi:hypothetical protein